VSNRLGVGMLGWGGEVSMSVVCAGGITVLIPGQPVRYKYPHIPTTAILHLIA
jgi:hypothetical protein